jgi:hypothetical protein
MVATAPLTEPAKLDPRGEASLDWSFTLDRNCPITDNISSLFLLYGQGEATEKLGQLELTVQPFSLIQEFLKTFQIQYRFVLKGQRTSKDAIEAKLAPPDSQAFATLDNIAVSFRFEGEILHVGYKFNVKKIEATAASVEVGKKQKALNQELGPELYKTSSGRVNHDKLEAAIKEALLNCK